VSHETINLHRIADRHERDLDALLELLAAQQQRLDRLELELRTLRSLARELAEVFR
jgi:hypothetical protein